jgi:[glutamine synthetase] adenylyltransferase / [glutamine synthetase]-adenylyl-L-tyrosine phosphorylase
VRPDVTEPAELVRLARVLGFADAAAFLSDIGRHMDRIAARFVSLLPDKKPKTAAEKDDKPRWAEAIGALERGNGEGFVDGVVRAAERGGASPFAEAEAAERWRDVGRDLLELARHPDGPLGARTRETYPQLAETVLDATVDAADPEQAARYLRMTFGRVRHPGIYARLLADDRRALRRLIEALGASAFVGDAIASNPELGDYVLFARASPTPEVARAEVAEAMVEALSSDEDPEEALVGALRRAKARVTIEVALADLAGEIGTREATLALSDLADATLAAAARHALGTAANEPIKGLAVLAMGKLGGREIGYGSDLDVLFLFDPAMAPAGRDPQVYFARAARQIIRLISVSHGAGPGYELDTRLRPSGNQGLLVTSLEAFARYHGASAEPSSERAPASGGRGSDPAGEGPGSVHVRAAAWERLALLRARAAAGDPELGARAMRVAHAAAYEMPFDAASARQEIHRLRLRMERENSQERRGRYDIKLGRGGLADIEFCVQLLQMQSGRDRRVRTTETKVAIDALATAGYLAPAHAEALREGYAFLRKLEQRMRIVHAAAAQLLEENAPGLLPLARRTGIRARRGSEATEELLLRYREVTERVRAVFDEIVAPPPA